MSSRQGPAGRVRSAVAAFSTIVEWYDFTLYLYFATVLSRVFYGGGAGSLLLTLGGFAIAYLMRPLGAVFFSHIGDRRGRRHMLLMSVATDDRRDVGDRAAADARRDRSRRRLAAPCAPLRDGVLGRRRIYRRRRLSARRSSGPGRRGLITSSASAASEVGALLAVGVSALTVSLMSAPALATWGWRIPFFVGAALAASVWIARSTMHEMPGVPAAAETKAPCQTSRLRHALSQSPRRNCSWLLDLGARFDHLLCRNHLRSGLPHVGRRICRTRRAVACRPSRRSR